jgi:hexosaminidase
MKKLIILLVTSFLLVTVVYGEVHNLGIIPKPLYAKQSNEFFKFNINTKIYQQPNSKYDLSNESSFFSNLFLNSAGFRLERSTKKPKSNYIEFVIDNSLNEFDYILNVKNSSIKITANSEQNIFWGLQSLRQLLPAEIESPVKVNNVDWNVPTVLIKDKARFDYRGLMLDVGRHFYKIDEVKSIIDLMSKYKMNVFHWHLTDDQGWRIEIKKYPLLTEIGSRRRETCIGKVTSKTLPKDRNFDCTPHEGYYTQEEIKEVVRYAKDRHVKIIPEIEMPGHALGALASYPQFGCTGGPYEVATMWGVFNDVYCPKEETFNFLEDVLSEVIELFPGEYIHIGGDECPKVRWKNCIHCQNKIKENGLKDEHELQSYFIKRIENFLNQKGKKIIGWDEIIEGGLAPNATVMSWRGVDNGIVAAKMGNDVIMTPRQFCYFDYYQSKDTTEPFAIGGFVPVSKVYSYNPVSNDLTVEEAKHILGVQANLWTEHISTFKQVQYMLIPRLLAMAEVQWTDEKIKSYPDFLKRAEMHKNRFDYWNYNYADHIFSK